VFVAHSNPGSNYIVHQEKILRMSNDLEGAIRVLQESLKPDRPNVFREADTLVSDFNLTILQPKLGPTYTG
jgi:hypothetical protein